MRSILAASLFILIPFALPAQQPQPSAESSKATITGIITLSDINRPARFAHVSLVPAARDDDALDQRVQTWVKDQRGRQPSPQEIAGIRTSFIRQGQTATEESTSVVTDLNGRYVLAGIAPGAYYLHVRLDGYADALDQFSLDQLTSADPDTARGIASLAPRITVLGTGEQRFDARLDRGASLSGRVLYDDGAPAAGWNVVAMPEPMLHRKPTDSVSLGVNGISGMRSSTVTDDLGNFRLRSLAPGSYGIAVSITEHPSTAAAARYPNVLHLGVYSGDTFHSGEAKIYNLTAGASRNDAVITIPLGKVHTIRGLVVAQSDGHALAHGAINLTSSDDPGLLSFTTVGPDGTFQLDEVPAGTYTLHASNITDAPPTPASADDDGKPTHTYGPASLPITLNDVDLTNITLTIPDAAPTSNNAPPPSAP